MVQAGSYSFDWLTEDQAGTLLGTARPKTLADIENDSYWDAIFDQWAQSKGGDIQQKHAAWKQDPKGAARDQLKSAGSGDLRDDFYQDLGNAKDALRKHGIQPAAQAHSAYETKEDETAGEEKDLYYKEEEEEEGEAEPDSYETKEDETEVEEKDLYYKEEEEEGEEEPSD
jgi:hypothetical protein